MTNSTSIENINENQSNSTISLLTIFINPLSTTMDRFHNMIGSCITWAISLTCLFLAIGWEKSTDNALFIIGIIPVFCLFILMLHFDRQYHRIESIQKKIVNTIEKKLDGENVDVDVRNNINSFLNEPLPIWRKTILHMTLSFYGATFAVLIFILFMSALIKA